MKSRNNHINSFALSLVVVMVALCGWSPCSVAQSGEMSEASLIAKIKKLTTPTASESDDSGEYYARHEQAIAAVDELLSRFPKSNARNKVLVTKLRLLADLARFKPKSLQQLLELTEEISKGHPDLALDLHNRWFAIQAFVYGARAEGMPGKLRLNGVMERYRAYIADFPKSPMRPVAYASLIRNLVLSDMLTEAKKVLSSFVQEFPDDGNTLSAQEEVLRPQLLGKPFEVIYTTRDGRKISTKEDFKGKVLVIAYWSGHSAKSTNIWSDLMYMFTKHGRNGLDMIGVSIDKDPELMKRIFKRQMTPWPNCVDQKIVNVGSGKSLDIYAVPCFIVLDRDGIVHDINHGVELKDVVTQLLYGQ